MSATLKFNSRPGQRGFSMVETMIAVLLFSLAVMSQASLQMLALANSKSADLKTTAGLLVDDISDRMRANQLASKAALYDRPAASDQGCSSVHFLDVHSAPATCTPLQVAQDDIWDWQQQLAAQLPDGTGVVCIDSTPDDGASAAAPACDGVGERYAVKIFWRERQAPSLTTGIGGIVTARLVLPVMP